HAIEKYSEKIARSLVVSDLLKKWNVTNTGSRRELNDAGKEAASKVAKEIVAAMDDIFAKGR
ncbi:hypothetical protein MUP38_07990, partial [Candidatus Bathyarchaeota archaeon]|nr:hypothetical protein [Candidatus Bathyarchaeota archaeon]